MTEQRKSSIIELYDGAKDQIGQILFMTKMGFGTKRQIVDVLHEAGRAEDIKIRSAEVKKAENDKTEKPEEASQAKAPDRLPMPQDLVQLLIDELDRIDGAIKEVEKSIREKEEKKKKLESLYKHIVEVISN